jgi:TPR repeat protein
MNLINSYGLAAHGKLWYDNKWYRLAWIIWPQALAVLALLWFWVAPPATTRNVQWAKPIDSGTRSRQLLTLRDNAKTNQSAMEALERDALGGEPVAQFYYATLFDPDLKLSTITSPDITKSTGWYSRAANQGDQSSMSNLAIAYSNGIYVRQDHSRACSYARTLGPDAFPGGLRVKGDCLAQGLGGTQVDMPLAASAYELSANKGNSRASATLGYFYENGIGGRAKSHETALKYYRSAADRGDALGLHNLGAAYNSGSLGLSRDPDEAARLIVRALETKYEITVQSLTGRPDLWTGDFWQSLQRRLSERALYTGTIDGRPNPVMLEAVRRLGRR